MEKKNFAWPVTVVGDYDNRAMKSFMKEYETVLKKKKIVIFGAGIRGTIFSILLAGEGYTDLRFTDNNEKKIGHYVNEFPIIALDEVQKEKDNFFIIISVENGQAIKEQLETLVFCEGIHYAAVENYVYANYIEKFFKEGEWETLIFGDCGLSDIGIKENNTQTLGMLLEEKNDVNKTKVLALHGMGMRAYYEIFKAHCKYVKQPKKLMVMANFETFTGKQHLLPRSQHVPVFEMLYSRLKDADIYEYMCLAQKRFSDITMDYFLSSKEHAGNSQNNDRLVIKMNYMYHLSLQNECVQYMFLLSEFCNENNIELAFFIPPVNYQYAEMLWGDRFSERYNDNCRTLIKEWDERGIKYLDLSYLLTSDCFADIKTIDECANYRGRTRQADEIVCFMKNM